MFNLLACEASAGFHGGPQTIRRLVCSLLPVVFAGPPEDLLAPLFFGLVSGFGTLANVLQGRNSDRNRAREWLSHQTNTSKTVKSGTSLTIYKDSVVLEGQINNTTIHQHASKGGSSAALEGRILDGELNSHGDVSLINPNPW